MSYVLNMVGGGGGGSLSATDAILRVQAPAGSTVTITKGSTTKSDQGHENADDNSVYDYYFIIHQSQFDATTPWTVTATFSGGGSNSRQVIVSDAQEYDVLIPEQYYFVNAGALSGGNIVAVGKKSFSGSSASAVAPPVSYGDGYIQCGWVSYGTGFQSGIIYFPEQVDLSKYNRVKVNGRFVFNVKSSTGSLIDVDFLSLNGWSSIGTYANDNRIFNYCPVTADDQTYDYTGVWEVDLSAVEDKTNAFIGMKLARNTNNSNTYVRIIDCWLE